MLSSGVLLREYVGRYNPEQKKSPVTAQCIISKKSFDQLSKATSKEPYYPWKNDRTTHLDMKLPKEVQHLLQMYIKNRIALGTWKC